MGGPDGPMSMGPGDMPPVMNGEFSKCFSSLHPNQEMGHYKTKHVLCEQTPTYDRYFDRKFDWDSITNLGFLVSGEDGFGSPELSITLLQTCLPIPVIHA